MDHALVGVADFGADGGSEAESHGAETAGGQQLSGIIEMEVLDGPHLMLSDVGGNDGILRADPRDGGKDLLRVQGRSAVRVFRFRGIGKYEFFPFAVILLGQPGVQHIQDIFRIADNVMVGADIFVDLRTVDVDMDDFGLAGKILGIQRDAVGETAADGDQQVTVVAGDVGSLGTVHTDHAGHQRIASADAAAAHNGDGRRGVDQVGKFGEFPVAAAANNTAAADQQRFFGFVDHLDQFIDIVFIDGRFLKIDRGTVDQLFQFSAFLVAAER